MGTVDLQVQHVDELFDPPSDAEYYAKAHIQIDCLLEQAGAVVEEVTDAGGQIQSIEFHLHDETRQHHQDTVLETVMERAREKADTWQLLMGTRLQRFKRRQRLKSVQAWTVSSMKRLGQHPIPISSRHQSLCLSASPSSMN
ncbi:hypothetical protein B9H04_06805 [Halorubrum ezzemoulense DSM 17463]|uniref:Uncharacterized protein n=1 Tax=Halorubrum ezzemoulense DSM 17463 TaxID=1121945 RepID=A0A1X4H8I5_HALEZ|nr:hypothetical protein B9H04_06805 [Halorubrum ezzemoulense DSM 17463]